MSLLREIQDAALDPQIPLASVLRKCMVLASRLGHQPFKKWVDDELNGYPQDAEVPAYRHVGGISSIGQFSGGFGAAMKNVPLGLGPVPPELGEKYQTIKFREGVAKLEEMVRSEGDLISRWPGDLVYRVANKYFEGYTLLEAHMEIPKNAVVGVLDAVRNKALKFALEIEEQAPTAGDVAPGTAKPVAEERVAQIFNTYIMGGAQNVAVGSIDTVQHAQQIKAGNLDELLGFLKGQGIIAGDLAELETAIAEDPAPRKGQALGTRVSGWIAKMGAKAASGAWQVGTSAVGEVLTAALKAYYGLS